MLTARCVARPKAAEFQKKLPRLQKIAESGSEAVRTGLYSGSAPLHTFAEALESAKQADCGVFLYEGGGIRFSEVPLTGKKQIALWIGSEGGFDSKEVEAAKAAGFYPVWLGERILRVKLHRKQHLHFDAFNRESVRTNWL